MFGAVAALGCCAAILVVFALVFGAAAGSCGDDGGACLGGAYSACHGGPPVCWGSVVIPVGYALVMTVSQSDLMKVLESARALTGPGKHPRDTAIASDCGLPLPVVQGALRQLNGVYLKVDDRGHYELRGAASLRVMSVLR